MTSQILTLILILISLSLISSNPLWYQTCGKSYNCGNITGIQYPFIGNNDPQYCGYPGLELNCNQDKSTTTILIKNMEYRVLDINPTTQIMRIAREDIMESVCPRELVNTTLDYNLFEFPANYMNLTFVYGCPSSPLPNFVTCNGNGVYVLLGAVGPGPCKSSVVVQVQSGFDGFVSRNWTGLEQTLRAGFEVRWLVDRRECRDCSQSSGRCGYDYNQNQTTCYCADPPYMADTCPMATRTPALSGSRRSGNQLDVVLPVVGAILAGIGMAWLFFFCRQRRRRRAAAQTALTAKSESKELTVSLSSKDISSSTTSTKFTRSIPSYPSTNEFGKSSTYFGVQVFSYAELEEATDNFDSSRELGDGGFGTVYYAKLVDGREVAVKRLYENNFKRVEQFLNEVEILTRLHHQYLVKLYGCTSKRSRELLLVYEYIPNGTVADHLHGKQSNSGLLSWPVRLNIAIETADALAYLHRSEIIHRDVKTNNILLDNEFRVKVADFGLSRLFPTDQTHVSTAPQGTPGYVDPEYYQCYQLTEKSDVYSFGVVLVELISSLQAVDTNRHRHDINLSNMAVNKIQNHELDGFVDPGLGFKTDVSVKRMMTLVAELAFQCLQQDKDMRPSMKEVLDSLREIQKEELDYQKAEVVDIVVDDTLPLKSNTSPDSPDSFVSENWVSSSAPNSIG